MVVDGQFAVAPDTLTIGTQVARSSAINFANAAGAIGDLDVIDLNEAFAAQALAVMRMLGLQHDAAQVNPKGGAIALGHPLSASGARLATTALCQLERTGGRYALATMCIGVGQGIALVIERV